MSVKELSRCMRCRHYTPGDIFDSEERGKHYCSPDGNTVGERWEQRKEIDPAHCDTCEKFESRYIEYPLTIDGIEITQPRAHRIEFAPVRVRLCNDNKTYFGILLGEFPWITSASLKKDDSKLRVFTHNNPCILIPDKRSIVFGAECWWQRIVPGEDISDIVDEDIENVWYVRLIKEIQKR